MMKLLLPKRVKNDLWFLRTVTALYIRWLRALVYTPIVVFTLGKVGSTTVKYSLEKAGLPNPVFHTHFLSKKRIYETHEISKSWDLTGKRPFSMVQGLALNRLGTLTWDRRKWKVITLVREPVGREISDLFQNPFHFPNLVNLEGQAFISSASAELRKAIAEFDPATNYTVCWFDWEIKEMFGLDLYQQAFDPAKGYAIYSSPRADILLIRMEDLSRCAGQAFQEFLGIPNFLLHKANEAAAKDYSSEYRTVLDSISFPPQDLEKVYNARYARHFYTPAEIQAFKQRWEQFPTEQG
jgi:hypothetical protein